MAALVGFLFVGQVTDWKLLGRKSKASSAVKFGSPELSRAELSRNGAHHSRHVRTGPQRNTSPHDMQRDNPNSEEVADRRPATHEDQKGNGQLD
jgi:hypothetical protein